MKIKRLKIDGFGIFSRKPFEKDFSSGINVIFGVNEAGKSTLRQAIRELLFGFSQKKSIRHPYGDMGGRTIGIQGDLEIGTETIHIQRTLGEKITGIEIYGHHMVTIKNEPIHEIGELSSEIYKGLYEMDLSDLVKLETQKWKKVKNQMSLQYGMDKFLSPKELLEDIEQTIHGIWRPHRRGNFAIKHWEETLEELEKKKSELVYLQEQKIKSVQEKDVGKEELKRIDHELKHLKSHQAKRQNQWPAWSLLKEIKKTKDMLKEWNPPAFTRETFVATQKENDNLREKKESLDDALARARRETQILSPVESSVFNQPETAGQIQQLYDAYCYASKQQENLENELSLCEKKIEESVKPLSKTHWKSVLDSWINLDINKLKKEISRRRWIFPGGKIHFLLWGIGLLLFLLTIRWKSLLWVGFGIVFFLTGFFVLNLQKKMGSLCYKNIDFSNYEGDDFVSFLIDCQNAQRDIKEYKEKSNSLKRHKCVGNIHRATLEKQLDKFYISREKTLEMRMDELSEHLSVVKKKIRDNDFLDKEKGKIMAQTREIGHELLKNQQKYNAMRSTLLKMGETVEKGLEYMEFYKDQQRHLEKIQSKWLAMNMSKEEVAELSEIEDMAQEMRRIDKEITRVLERRENIKVELAHLKNEQKSLMEDKRLSHVLGEIESARTKKKNAIDIYNREKMLHTLISYADEQFQKIYQPDIFQRASHWVNVFTNGSYSRIVTDKEGGLKVLKVQTGEYETVHDQFSRGTKEQIYMAMRIALAESLEGEGNKNPLVLDEVFVNWDEDRLKSGLKSIFSLGTQRQIFYLTCHEWMAQILEYEYGARRINL